MKCVLCHYPLGTMLDTERLTDKSSSGFAVVVTTNLLDADKVVPPVTKVN